MPSRPRSFGWDTTLRCLRFFYLLWGGMLLATLSLYGRLRLPGAMWAWPTLCRMILGAWGRGIILGFGLVMLVAALSEIWEIVDRILVRFLGDP